MNVKLLTTPTLIDLHNSIARCLAADDAMPQGDEPYYGVRLYKDWPKERDAFEAELERRSIEFTHIDF